MKRSMTNQNKIALGCIASTFILVAGIAIGHKLGSSSTTIIKHELPQLSEWEKLQMAIIKTESEFDSLAVGKTKDLGIFQITPIYVDEVNRILGEEVYDHADALNPEKAVEMFSIYQNYKNPTLDIDKAIQKHNPNGGYGYAVKVKRNLAFINAYERYRKIIKNNE